MENIKSIEENEITENTVVMSGSNLYVFFSFIASLCGVDLEAETNYFKEHAKELAEKNEMMKEQIDVLIKDKEHIEKINEKLLLKKRAQKDEINEFCMVVTKLKEQNNDLKQENEQLKQEKEKMIREIKILRKVITNIEKENEILKDANNKLNKIIEDYRKIDMNKISDMEIKPDSKDKQKKSFSENLSDKANINDEYTANLDESNKLKLALNDFDYFIELTNVLNNVICKNCELIEEHNNLLKLKKDFEMIIDLKTGIFKNHK